MTEHIEAKRKTVITGISINSIKRDDPFFPNKALIDDETISEVWQVWIQTRSGFLPEVSSVNYYLSEAEALAATEQHQLGATIDDIAVSSGPLKKWSREYLEKTGHLNFIAAAGDGDLYLPWEVLKTSGLTDARGVYPSKLVIDFLGPEKTDDLQERYVGNWISVAVFQYCWMNLPHSSPAYVAAACNYNFFVANDDFSAGYLLRDLEILVYGVEAEATKAMEMRKKAGEKGKEASSKARTSRIASLLDGMEKVALRNPDICALGVKSLATLGLKEAERENPSLWAQGRGQAEEYLGEIRRGEAGKGFQSRYHALFPKKPPMGF